MELKLEKTLVKVRFVLIKYFDEESNEVKVDKVMGALTIPECRKYVKDLFNANIYITREIHDETFPVDTVALYSLKQEY